MEYNLRLRYLLWTRSFVKKQIDQNPLLARLLHNPGGLKMRLIERMMLVGVVCVVCCHST